MTTAPRFALGERVVMSRDNPPTHTRLPAYARGCTGTVVAWHGGFDFADTQAQGIHDVAEHLDTVRFEAVPIFAEPWQAKAFAITVTLSRSGLITWPGWAATLGAEIALHPQRPGEGGRILSAVGCGAGEAAGRPEHCNDVRHRGDGRALAAVLSAHAVRQARGSAPRSGVIPG